MMTVKAMNFNPVFDFEMVFDKLFLSDNGVRSGVQLPELQWQKNPDEEGGDGPIQPPRTTL